MSVESRARRRFPLHTQILLGMLVGAGAGITSNALWRDSPSLLWAVDNVAQPIGQVFLRMLFMVVVPLVFTSLALGVASLGDLSRVGRIGGKTIAFFLLTTTFAVIIGLTLANVIQPGASIDAGVREGLVAQFSSQAGEKLVAAQETTFGINTFVNIVPRNPLDAAARGDMLALIFFTLVFAVALTRIPSEYSAPVVKVIEGVGKAVMVMIGFAMRFAPIGVAALIFGVTARFGFDLLRSLGLYAGAVLLGLAIHQFLVIPTLARILAGIRPMDFLRRTKTLMITAFSTSSSNATLPTTIRTAEEEFGVPREVAGFVLPLGATMNMNGTALFEGMTVLFLAQVFGISLSLPMQLMVVVMSVITAVGVAGVPSGSIPLLVMVLGMVGVPGEGIALVLGIDRILDMARTVPNVSADLLTSLWVTKSEGLAFATPGVPSAGVPEHSVRIDVPALASQAQESTN